MLSRDDQQLSYPCAASHTPVSASVTLLEPQDGSISSGGFEDDELVSAAGVELSRSPWVRLGSFGFASVATHPTGLTVFVRTFPLPNSKRLMASQSPLTRCDTILLDTNDGTLSLTNDCCCKGKPSIYTNEPWKGPKVI